MKYRIFTIILLSFIVATNVIGQKLNDIDFNIILASGFESDTISLKVNNNNIIESEIITSNLSLGLTGLSVYQNKNNLVVISNNEKALKEKVLLDKKIDIEVNVNNKVYFKTINLKKGKNIFIDFDDYIDNEIVIKKIFFRQYKKTVIVE